jgi:hypothetical protein
MNDDDLKRLIRESCPPPEFPASFRREVWARIAVTENRSFASAVQRMLARWGEWMTRPAMAVATVLSMLIIGAGLGGMTQPKPADRDLKMAYAASINPILSAHTGDHK